MSSLHYPLASSTWDSSEIDAMQDVIQSMNFTMGNKVFEFEEAFAEFFGSNYAVMSNSGSSANLLAIAAMRYKSKPFMPGGEVIVPAVSWGTTYFPVHQLGFQLKFVDIDESSLNATAKAIEEAVSDKTVGIFVVNLLGNPSDLISIRQIADKYGLFMIEDNCESMGATLDNRFSGTYGDIGTFSTFFSHHISTMEGGMCVTDDLELAQIMISLRAHGWLRGLPDNNYVWNKSGDEFEDSFKFVLPGYNLRPLELSGALGLEQLKKLPSLLAARRENAEIFIEKVSEIPGIKIQQETGISSWFGFSMILEKHLSGKRSDLVTYLSKNRIESRPIVAGNFTTNPVMKHLDYVPLTPLPSAEKIDVNGLFVGNHHYNISQEISFLADLLRNFSQSDN